MSEKMGESEVKRHPIKVVSRRSGLSIDVLRVWEKRYGLVVPGRTKGGHRLYSDSDIERLRLTKQAADGGRRVSRLANLSIEELHGLVDEDLRESAKTEVDESEAAAPALTSQFVGECIEEVKLLDSTSLAKTLARAMAFLSPHEFIESVAAPMMREIGDLWHARILTPAHEHMASAVLRTKLAEMTAVLQPEAGGSTIVIATPAGQHHEIGALLVTATAELAGYHAMYLGPDLPADDICAAVTQTEADAVALSITVDQNGGTLERELRSLGELLPRHVRLLVGGQAAGAYASVLEECGAKLVSGMPELRLLLMGPNTTVV